MLRHALVLLLALYWLPAPIAAGVDDPPPVANIVLRETVLRGTVLRLGGAGFPDAEIVVRRMPSNHDLHLFLLDGQPLPEEMRARSTMRGDFELSELGPGVWQVEVYADGFVPMRLAMVASANPRTLPPVRLRPAVRSILSVVDEAGAAIAGVGVYAKSGDPELWDDRLDAGAWRPALRVARSDEEGRFVLLRLHGERLSVQLRRPGYLASVRINGVRQGPLVFPGVGSDAAQAGSAHTVVVRDLDGTPHAAVVVAGGAGAWPLGRVDADGRLTLLGSLPEPIELWIFSDDGRTRVISLAAEGNGATGAPVEAQLAPLVPVSGRVLDDHGAPVAGAIVWPGHAPGAFVTTSNDGRFALRVPGRDRSRLQAHARGFLPRSIQFAAALDDDGVAPSVELVMVPASAVAGRVRDARGQPLAGVRVSARAEVPEVRPAAVRNDAPDSRAVTDALGRFALAGLAPGTGYAVRAERDGFAPLKQSLAALEPGEMRRVPAWTLIPGRGAFGVVLDAAERPLEGIEVRVTASRTIRLPRDTPTAAVAATDAEGRFRLYAPLVETVDIEASGGPFSPLRVRGLRLPEGTEAADLGILIMIPGVTLAGQVLDLEGKPVADATIRVAAPDERQARRGETRAEVRSDQHGRFRLAGLAPDTALGLVVTAAGFLPKTVADFRVPAPENVEIRLAPAAQVSGVVVDDRGTPMAVAEVTLVAESSGLKDAGSTNATRPTRTGEVPVGGGQHSVMTEEDGSFAIEAAPGAVRLHAAAAAFVGSESTRLQITVDTPVVGVRLVLRAGAELVGHVTDTEGAAISGARVVIGDARGFANQDGVFRVAGIAPGSALAVVTAAGFNGVQRAFELVAGDAVEADFVLAGGHPIAGSVVDANGLALAGAEMALERDDDSLVGGQIRSRDDGSFVFPRVADGAYRIRATLRGYVEAWPAVRVEVVGGPIDGLEVPMQTGAVVAGDIVGLEFDDLARVDVWATDGDDHRRPGEVDYAGRYRIEDLAPRDWTVEAMVRGGGRVARARVTIAADQPEVERDLVFGGGITLTGVVLQRGEVVPDTVVSLRGQSVPANRTVRSARDGRFRIDDLAAGRYWVGLAQQARRLAHTEQIELLDDREVVLEFRTARVAGQVTDGATGAPLGDARILLRPIAAASDGSVFGGSSGQDGRFSFDDVAAGRYQLQATRQGYQPDDQAIEVVAAADLAGIRVALAQAEGLAVAVRLASGVRPTFIILYGVDDQGRSYTETRPSDEAGQAHFDSLPAGRWQLTIGGTGGAAVEARVTVPGEPLSVVLPPAGRLQVRVPALLETESFASLRIVAADGRPFQNLKWGGVLERDWPVAAGRAMVEGVPAGVWNLLVALPGGRVWTGSAVTTGGPDVETRLD